VNDHTRDHALGVNDLGPDLQIGRSRRAFETRPHDGAHSASESPAHVLGRNDQPDRVDRSQFGHDHTEELACLLVNDRAAATARLKRAVDLE